MPEKHKLQGKAEEKDNEQISLGERLLKSRTILLAEPITKEVAEKVTAKLLLLEQDDESAPINLYVNSPGGDVDAGFAIFDMIRYISAPVRCISNGLTASAAVIVLLAAPLEQRLSLPNSRVLMHQPSTGVKGSTADIRIEANEILKIRKKINNLISEETGQDFEQVKEDTRRNYWIGAKEAKEYGLISRIIESKSELED
ncbi:MAG: ClpP family protease [Candidatus Brocadiia bacterium]